MSLTNNMDCCEIPTMLTNLVSMHKCSSGYVQFLYRTWKETDFIMFKIVVKDIHLMCNILAVYGIKWKTHYEHLHDLQLVICADRSDRPSH